MMILSQSQIQDINKKCQEQGLWDQGLFVQGNGIPLHIKELCIYSRYQSGGRPGTCWDTEDTVNEEWTCDAPHDHFKVIDITLEVLCPGISSNTRLLINGLIDKNVNTEYGYYGDYDEWTVEFIPISDLYVFLRDHKIEQILE